VLAATLLYTELGRSTILAHRPLPPLFVRFNHAPFRGIVTNISIEIAVWDWWDWAFPIIAMHLDGFTFLYGMNMWILILIHVHIREITGS
jgi:hypothetical protein